MRAAGGAALARTEMVVGEDWSLPASALKVGAPSSSDSLFGAGRREEESVNVSTAAGSDVGWI
jgi:hypothetical protein